MEHNDDFRQPREHKKRFDGPRHNNRRFNDGPREMHKATCSSCGAECEVPFKPKEDRPVYCRDCFKKQREARA